MAVYTRKNSKNKNKTNKIKTNKIKTNKTKNNKSRRILPKLRPIDDSKKKHKYKLSYPTLKRRLAINEGIRHEVNNMNKTKKQAALAKKGRFNILRIYRRNNNKPHCKLITRDMKYIDKKYGLNHTSDIC
tara:strand:+ start:371 stop:760 length:390 start_codon:yes stop_codon:yes gene_type:complete